MSGHSQYRPEEFFPILDQLPKEGEVVICGGQAVNLLAAVFLYENQIEEILGSDGSATSGDMDIMITKNLQSKISELAGKSRGFAIQSFADCRQPIQFAILSNALPDTRIDVLRTIKGIHTEKDRVFEEAIELENMSYAIINPVTLLIAKAVNCATLEQDSPTQKRNDVKHLQLLVPIVHNYFVELIQNCPVEPETHSKVAQRIIIGFLKRLHKASANASFTKGMKRAGVKLRDVYPIAAIVASELSVLQKFTEITLLKTKKPPGTI
jgi:hypothetical protein